MFRKLIGLAMIALLVFAAAPSYAADDSLTPTERRQQAREKAEERRKAAREKRDQQMTDREDALKEIANAFGPGTPDWKAEVKGQKQGNAAVCTPLGSWGRRREAFDTMKEKQISWSRLYRFTTVREDDARAKFRDDGIKLAKQLVALAEASTLPASTCHGLYLGDRLAILDQVVLILERIKKKPEDIETTTDALRSLVEQEFVAVRVPAARIAANPIAALKAVVFDAKEWGLSPADIGLSAQEIQQTKTR